MLDSGRGVKEVREKVHGETVGDTEIIEGVWSMRMKSRYILA
jgi:hypothetical protein